jgi:hypothetical protein
VASVRGEQHHWYAVTTEDLGDATGAPRPLTDVTEAFSGARLAEADLVDGRHVVLKYLPPNGDWLTRATDGAGRLRRLWEDGVLRRVEDAVDHTILDLRRVDGQDIVVMRDARDDLLPPKVTVSVETSRQLLTGLARMHELCRDLPAGDRLCSIGARYAMFRPDLHAGDAGPGRHPMADRIQLGWELFAEHVDPDVVDAVFTVHRRPDVLEQRLARFRSTLLHGDAKLENLGLRSHRLVAIDWGDLTGVGPCEIDVAWYALKGAVRIRCSPSDLFAQYEVARGTPLHPEAVDLACLGSLAQMGFRYAVGAFDAGPEPRDVAAAQLDWWVARTRTALDRIGSL